MRKRLAGIKRIFAAEQQLRRVAEAKLAELHKREADLDAARDALLAALNGDQPLNGSLVGAMATRLKRCAAQAEEARRAREAQAQKVLERYGREKRAERLADAIEKVHRQATAKSQLQELLEQCVRASLP